MGLTSIKTDIIYVLSDNSELKYVFMIVAFLIVLFWLAKKIQFRRIFANQKFQ